MTLINPCSWLVEGNINQNEMLYGTHPVLQKDAHWPVNDPNILLEKQT